MKKLKIQPLVIYSDERGIRVCSKKDKEEPKKIWFQSMDKYHPSKQLEDHNHHKGMLNCDEEDVLHYSMRVLNRQSGNSYRRQMFPFPHLEK